MTRIFGSDGLLGRALLRRLPYALGMTRQHYDLATSDPKTIPDCSLAYLCAGTKGFKECEGNTEVFRADVDGNIRLAKHLLRMRAFVVFISTEGVEWGSNLSYAKNRMLVEMALVMQDNVAIVRPGKFHDANVNDLADFCAQIGELKLEGVHYWRPDERSV